MADGTDFVFRPIVPHRPPELLRLLPYLWNSWRDPLTVYTERHYAEPYIYVRGKIGVVMNLADPAGLRRVLVDNAKNYEKGDFSRRILGPLVADGVFMTEDEVWRRQRRILAPLFTPAKLSTLAQAMQAVCDQRIAAWPVEKGASSVVEIDPEMTKITFEIISDTMFSNLLGGEAGDFEKAFDGFVETTGRLDPFDILAVPLWVPRLTKLGGGGRYAAFFERRVNQMVAERRALIAGGSAPQDLLTALLGARDSEGGGALSDREVCANVLTFILAGHETTARALGWTLHLLARTPWYQEKVRAEALAQDLTDPGWQSKMPWSRAVFDEAMRLFPPAPTTLRFAREEDELCGRPIPPGSLIGISPFIIHRHKLLWDDPEAFRPERFLPGEREKIDRFAYIPFGQGPRICIGATFAIQEALIALGSLMRAFEFQPAELAEPMPTHRITLRAKDGIRLKVVSRA